MTERQLAAVRRSVTSGRPFGSERWIVRTAKVLHLRLKGIFDPPKGGSPFGTVTMSTATFDANYPKPRNFMTLINIRGGVTDANTARRSEHVQDP